MNKEIIPYLPIAEAISLLLYPHGEVVIHDLKTERIAAIYNPFSKRKVGDDSLLDDIPDISSLPDVFPPYFKTNYDGRKMKSITATLRNSKGKAFALLCINLDVSKWEELCGFISTWIQEGIFEKPDLLFKEDWREKINVFVSSYLKEMRTTLKNLKKEEKLELVRALKEEGAFQAKNASHYIADVLEISRATLYNYLRSL